MFELIRKSKIRIKKRIITISAILFIIAIYFLGKLFFSNKTIENNYIASQIPEYSTIQNNNEDKNIKVIKTESNLSKSYKTISESEKSELILGGNKLIVTSSGDIKGNLTISGQKIISSNPNRDTKILAPTLVTNSKEKANIGENGINNILKIYQTIKVGSYNTELKLSNGDLFDINFQIPNGKIGEKLFVFRSSDGENREQNSPEKTCILDNHKYCNFKTNHLTFFTVGSDSISGDFIIDNDNSYITGLSVTLNMDINGATHMKFGNSAGERDNASWISYGSTYSWTLTGDGGEGTKTVYAMFKNNDYTGYVEDIIFLDYIPTIGFTGITENYGNYLSGNSFTGFVDISEKYLDYLTWTRNNSETLFGRNMNTFQNVLTSGAFDFEYFIISGEHYLAVANLYNGTTRLIDSVVYKWNGANFQSFQNIRTTGAADREYFSISGEHYLAVANNHDMSSNNTNSVIYKRNGSSFQSIQSIATNGARNREYFNISGENYLAVANYYNGTTRILNSPIYKWDGFSFGVFQNITTTGALDREYFSISGEHYLAVANHHNNTTYNINSVIYKRNGTNFQFFQNIPSIGAYSFKFFNAGGNDYLALSNITDGSTRNLNSPIYKRNGTNFQLFQNFDTTGAVAREYFNINGIDYIINLNYYDGVSYKVNSPIYKISGDSFVLYQNLTTTGNYGGKYFTISGEHFLAVPTYYNGSSYSTNSSIFKRNLNHLSGNYITNYSEENKLFNINYNNLLDGRYVYKSCATNEAGYRSCTETKTTYIGDGVDTEISESTNKTTVTNFDNINFELNVGNNSPFLAENGSIDKYIQNQIGINLTSFSCTDTSNCSISSGTNNNSKYYNFNIGDISAYQTGKIYITGKIESGPDFSSQSGRAYLFDGTNDYIENTNSIANYLGNNVKSISVSFRLKNNLTDNDGIFYIGNFAGLHGKFGIYLYSTGISLYLNYPNFVKSATFTDTANWHHIVATYDGLSGKLYIDKTNIIDQPFTEGLDLSGLRTIIGGYYNSTYTMNGKLSDFRIFKKALSTGEIEKLYNKDIDLTGGLVSWYKMDEGGGYTAYDSRSGNDGSIKNAIASTFHAIDNSGYNFLNNLGYSEAISFDGINDYLTVTNNSDFDFGYGDFTIDRWENKPYIGTGRGIIVRDNGVPNGGVAAFLLGYMYNGSNRIYMSSTGLNRDIASSRNLGTPDYNKRSHLAIVRNGINFYAFKNGIITDSWTSSAKLLDGRTDLQLGNYSTNQYGTGSIKNIRFTKGLALRTSNFTPPRTESDYQIITGNTVLFIKGDTDSNGNFIDSAKNHTITNNGSTAKSFIPRNEKNFCYSIDGFDLTYKNFGRCTYSQISTSTIEEDSTNNTTQTFTIIFSGDKTKPIVELIYPINSTGINSTNANFVRSGNDGNGMGISGYYYELFDVNNSLITNGFTTNTGINLNNLEIRDYKRKIIALDLGGNRGYSNTGEFYLYSNDFVNIPYNTSSGVIQSRFTLVGYDRTGSLTPFIGSGLVGNKPISFISTLSGYLCPQIPVYIQSTGLLNGNKAEVQLNSCFYAKNTNGSEFTGMIQIPNFYNTGSIPKIKIINQNLNSVISVGSTGNIHFKNSFGGNLNATFRVPLSYGNIGDQISVYYFNDINNIYPIYLTSTVITGINEQNYAIFSSDHFTYFSLGEYTGNFVIDNDNLYTTGTDVVLNINVDGATHMKFGNSESERDAASWISYTSSYNWNLASGEGNKTVYAMFKSNTDTGYVYDEIILNGQPSLNFTGVTTTYGSYIDSSTKTIIGLVDIDEYNISSFSWRLNNTTITGSIPSYFNQLNTGKYSITNYNDTGLALAINFDNYTGAGESGTLAKDWSTYNNSGTINGAIWTGNGFYNGAYNFDGSNDYIDLGSPSSLDLGQNFTVSARVNINTLKKYAGVVNKVVAARNGVYSYMLVIHNNGTIGAYNGSTWLRSTNAGITGGNQYFVTWTLTGGKMYYYVDGKNYGSNTFSYTDNTTHNVFIGSWSTNTIYDFDGIIDDVRIYNYALSENEIKNISDSSISKYGDTKRLFQTYYKYPIEGYYDFEACIIDNIDNNSCINKQINMAKLKIEKKTVDYLTGIYHALDYITYIIDFGITSGISLTGINITDTLNTGLSYISSSLTGDSDYTFGTGLNSSGELLLNWDNIDLFTGATGQIILTAQIIKSFPLISYEIQNSGFLDNAFWNQSPNSGEIIDKLYSTSSAYTQIWKNYTSSTCNISNVVHIYPGGSIPTNLTTNTIYVVHSGNYIVSSTISTNTCSALIGIGDVLISSNAKIEQLIINSYNQVIIDNIKIDGAKGHTSDKNNYGIRMYREASNNTINNIESFNNASGGLKLNLFENNTQIKQWFMSNNLVNNSIFYNNGGVGLSIYTTIYDGQYPFQEAGINSNNVINNCQFFNNGRGLLLYSLVGGNEPYENSIIQYNTINNCQIYNNTNGLGLLAASSSYTNGQTLYLKNDHNTIYNTSIYNNSNFGIYMFRSGWLGYGYLGDNNFVDINLYNNGNGFETINTQTNKYYNNIVMYNNDVNFAGDSINKIIPGSDLEFSNLGRSRGIITTGNTLSGCSYVANPRGSGGVNLFTNNCTTRGIQGSFNGPLQGVIYGYNIQKQTRPIRYLNTTNELVYYGSDLTDYYSGVSIAKIRALEWILNDVSLFGNILENRYISNNEYKPTTDLRINMDITGDYHSGGIVTYNINYGNSGFDADNITITNILTGSRLSGINFSGTRTYLGNNRFKTGIYLPANSSGSIILQAIIKTGTIGLLGINTGYITGNYYDLGYGIKTGVVTFQILPPGDIDTIKPTATLLSPTDGSGINTSYTTFTWTGSDGTGSGISGFVFKLLSGSSVVYSSGTKTGTTISLTGLNNQTYSWLVEVEDNYFNTGISSQWFFDVDYIGPTLSFIDNVELGPVTVDYITGNWGDSIVSKWTYTGGTTCSTNSGDYEYTSGVSMIQATETNNGKYICLYGEDDFGNKSVLKSANDINIDTTSPILIFTGITQTYPSSITGSIITGLVDVTENNLSSFTWTFNGISETYYTELTLDTGLILRLDASYLTGTNGSSIQTWYDKSLSGNNAIQNNVSYRPTLITNAINGKNVVDFTPTQSISSTNFNLSASPFSVFYVTKMKGGTTGRILQGYSNNWLLGFHSNTENDAYFGGRVYNGITTATTSWKIYEAIGDGTTSTFRSNGVQLASNSLGLQGPNGIGINESTIAGTEDSNAQVAEILIYNRALLVSERQKIEKYLRIKYLNSGELTNIGGNKRYFNKTITGLADGSYTYQACATDIIGLTGCTIEKTTIIDNYADINDPIITLLSPTDGSGINTPYTTFTWTGSDGTGSGISGFVFNLLSGGSIIYSSGTNTGTTISLTGLNSQTYSWFVEATDNLNNTGSSNERNFYIDNIAPITVFTGITLNYPEEITGTTITGLVDITESNLYSFVWNLNGLYLTGIIPSYFNNLITGNYSLTNYNDTGLILAMNFDNYIGVGESSTTIKDRSNYNNTGTANGPIRTGNGRFNGSYRFDGLNDIINIYDDVELETSPITFSTWIKTNSNMGGVITSHRTNVSTYGGFVFYITPAGKLQLYITTNGSTRGVGGISSDTSINNNIRHNVAFTYKSGETKIYIDGIQQNTGSTLAGSIVYNGYQTIGADTNGNFLSGQIDDVRLYNRALSSGEIQQLYNTTINKYDINKRLFQTSYFELANGSYLYQACATDIVGLTGCTIEKTTIIYNYVDITGPTINLLSPTNGSGINTPYTTFTWTGSDGTGSGISGFIFNLLSGGSVIYSSGTNSGTTITLTGLNNQTYSWFVEAEDNNGNTGSSSEWTIFVDTIAPTTTISDTNSNWRSPDITNITLSANDGNGTGVDNTYYKIANGDVSCIAGGYSVYSSAFSVTGSNGDITTKTVCFYSIDKLNNTESFNKQLYNIDNQNPTIEQISPLSGSTNTNGNINLTWSGNDGQGAGISGYIYQLSTNISFTNIVSSGITNSTTTGANINIQTNGTYYRRIIAIDNVNNQSTSEIWNLNVNIDIVVNCIPSGDLMTSITISGFHNQVYSRRVTAIDNLGNSGTTEERDFIYDDISPITTLISPENSISTGNQNIGLIRSGNDIFNGTGSGISGYIYEISTGSDFNIILYSGETTNTGINLTSLSDNTYYRHAKAYDKAGNTGDFSSTWDFTIIQDSTGPEIYFTGNTPSDNSTINTNGFSGLAEIIETDLKSVNRNRNGQEISLYDSGLVLMMNFDNILSLGETTGLTINDWSLYGNNGTGYNGISWTNNGRYKGSYSFDGNNSYIEINDTNYLEFLSSDSFTIELFVKTTFSGGRFVTKRTGMNGNNRYSLGIQNGKLYTEISTDYPNNYLLKFSTENINDGGWHQVSVVRNKSTNKIYLYIDGQIDGIESADPTTDLSNTGNIWIGKYGTEPSLNGQIDEVRIYKRALSSGEIELLYKTNLAKIDSDKWQLEFTNQCIVDGNYSYSVSATDNSDNTTTTGRNITIELPSMTIGTPTYGLNISTGFVVSFQSQTGEFNFTGEENTFRVNDTKGYTGWYTTIQLSGDLINSGGDFSIPQENISFKANDTIAILEGSASSGVILATGINEYNILTGIYDYIIKAVTPECSSCIIGKYGNNPSLKVTIPAYQKADTYNGTLIFTLYN